MGAPDLRLVEGRPALPAGAAKLDVHSLRDPDKRASVVREWLGQQDEAHSRRGRPSWRLVVFYAPHKGAQLQRLAGHPAGLATSVSRTQSAYDLLLGHSWRQLVSIPLAQVRTLTVETR